MNRINLLRTNIKKKKSLDGFKIPGRVMVVFFVVALLSGTIIVGLNYYHKKVVAVKPIAPKSTTSPFKPSTYTNKASIVEDVVREVGSKHESTTKSGILAVAYNDLSFFEKINYEVLFAKNVLEMFSRAIPSGIGLKSLEIENFQTLYAVGLGNTRELVSTAFIALKSEKVELLPRPLSYITSNNGDGYRFVVTCKINTGLDLSDPFQAIDYLPTRDDIPIIIKKIMSLAEADSVLFTGLPVQVNVEPIGAYRRFHYNVKGVSTYNNFVKLLLSLHSNKVPCAFKKIDIKARNGLEIDINTHLIFTAKE